MNPSIGIKNHQEGFLNPSNGIKNSWKDTESLQWNYNPQERYLNPSSGIKNPLEG